MIKNIQEMVALVTIQAIALLWVTNIALLYTLMGVIAWQVIRLAQWANRPVRVQREGYKRLSCEIPVELHNWVKEQAKQCKLSITKYIELLILDEAERVAIGVTDLNDAKTREVKEDCDDIFNNVLQDIQQ